MKVGVHVGGPRGLLIRVGIDQAFGGWNGPVDPVSNEFVYLPIPEKIGTPFHDKLERQYDEFEGPLAQFGSTYNRSPADLHFPTELSNHPVHLDPDFQHLTYGDDGGRRGSAIRTMTSGDLLAFYAGLKPITACRHKLVYALIGLYVIDEVVEIHSVPKHRWYENAHTRKSKRGPSDIVVRARRGISGRLDRCIPIGEWRAGAYRVTNDVLEAWGGLSVKDGYIQRSARPPAFMNPGRFSEWFEEQGVGFRDGNN